MKYKLSGGGGGGGGSTFRNRPDNLRSTDTFEALLGLATGRIRGLAPGGLQNYFVNGVPLEDGSGNKTLEDFSVLLHDGDPAVLQPVKLQLGGSSGSVTVGLAVDNANTSSTSTAGPAGDWRYGSIATPGVDYIDLRFVVEQLMMQDEEGIYDATASIEIELQPSGTSTWINPLIDVDAPTYSANGFDVDATMRAYLLREHWDASDTTQWNETSPGFLQITGKTTQAYIKEIRISVPNDGAYEGKTWGVRCRLMERDSFTDDTSEERRTILWESIAGVSSETFGGTEDWRGLAYLQINGKASDQLRNVPSLEGIFDLCEVKVPPTSVWDAETRVYTGAAWDGATEEIRWTTCPAFQLKDLIEDDVSGISALIPGSTLNKWDCLEASKWYAELVSDGDGGTHPRYSMNYLLDSALSIEETVQYVAGATGSFAWDRGDGQWRLVVDKPENPVALFTKEDIVGEFNYSHTDLDTRYNEIIGVFRNEANRFQEDRVRVFDQDHIDIYGKRTTSFALIGCTNRQEALRRCKLRQLSSLYETKQVSFVTTRRGALLKPFDVVLISDSDLGNFENKTTGRIIGRTDTALIFRDKLHLELGLSYEIHVTVPNPDYDPDTTTQPDSIEWKKPTITVTRQITNDSSQRGLVNKIYIDEPLPENTPKNASVAFEATGLPALPKQFRVVSVELDDQNEELVTVVATEIYTAKWDESDSIIGSEVLSQQPSKIVPKPENLTVIEDVYESKYITKKVLNAQWERPLTYWFRGFKVAYKFNNGPEIILDPETQNTFAEISDPEDGLYEFRIYTLDRRGGISMPEVQAYFLGESPPPGAAKVDTSDSSIVIQADASGVVLGGELPYEGWATYRVGDADVTALTTWEVVEQGCTATIDSNGDWEITAVASSGRLLVSGTFEGNKITKSIDVTKTLQPAPPGGTSGGGAGSSDPVTLFVASRTVSNSTYATSPTEYCTINSGASGDLVLDVLIEYNTWDIVQLSGKIVYREVGDTVWTDAGAEITGTPTSIEYDDTASGSKPYPIRYPGYVVDASFDVTGLTTSTDYEVGILLRLSSGSSSPTSSGRIIVEGNV